MLAYLYKGGNKFYMVNNSVNLVEMGNRIRHLRSKQKKTQKYFADMLYISPSYLTLIEQGKRTVTLDVLAQIAKVCDVSTDYLLFGKASIETDSNSRTFHRLADSYSPKQVNRALKLAEFYLSMNSADSEF